ncbi:MAG: TadE/TadG family type IV pilus assembly protein [Coprococcus sp.]
MSQQKQKKQAIGEIDTCKKRAVPSVFFSGSLTVEATLVLPVFLGAILLLTGLFQALSVCEQVNNQLCMTGRHMAAYSEAYDGSSLADAYKLFFREIDSSGIDKDSIAGGYSGIVLGVSQDETTELLELSAFYRINVPGYFIGNQSIAVSDRIYVRPWTGEQLTDSTEGDISDDHILVYVAENGVVYHTSEECTYLHLSIHQCSLSEVDDLRNRYGAKYVPCELCGESSGNSMVYITDTGRAWHSDSQCSGLKRELHTMTKEEADECGLRPCSRCGGQ